MRFAFTGTPKKDWRWKVIMHRIYIPCRTSNQQPGATFFRVSANCSTVKRYIDTENIKLVILAIDRSDQSVVEKLINRLSEKDVAIKIQANTLDIISGSVKTNNVLGPVLIDLHNGLMPEWQQNIKRVIDMLLAFVALILLSPLFILH